jgi:tripartite-type tricarboxylate transporter receptor subunit TctC
MAETVVKSPPDGYTLLVAGSTVWIAPLLLPTSYDPVKDLAPISMTDRAPLFLVVHPSLPVKSVKELIDLAKSRPGHLNYAAGGIGGSMQLSMELFKYMARVDIVSISYKGGAQALSDLVAGQVQVIMSNSATLPGYIKAGRLRAVAITSAEPSALYPGVPTIASTGLPGYESVGTGAVFAPAKTPENVIRRLNQEITRVLVQADVKEKFLNSGTEAATTHSPEQLATAIRNDITRFGKMIKDVGIKMN